MISKTEIIAADFYQPYLDQIKEVDINNALQKNTKQFRQFLKNIPRKKIDHAYAEGKWTIREMLQHIIDSERVFAYRALRFSRKDPTPLAGFDEGPWAAQAGGADRHWKDLVDEFKSVRNATEYLFASLSDDQLRFVGEANGRPMNAFTLGYIIPGHVAHHMRIIKERYL
ncbi:MAG TPA: DinB family protein [Puia sp.]|nr:DinB family protein [Puia sp.]